MSAKRTSTTHSKVISKEFLWPFILITSMFFAWGLANNMTDTLLSAFKKIMTMSDVKTTLVQFSFYGAYFSFALPAAFFIRKYTYKTGILFGLALFIIGALMFYPASQSMEYTHFLVALYVLAGGLAFLETSANPYIVELGAPETGTQRLNLAQSFNPMGSITGVALSQIFILSQLNTADAADRTTMSASELGAIQAQELSAVMGPYVGVAGVLICIWVLIKFTNMPEARASDTPIKPGVIGRLLSNKNYVLAVIAQFFYVSAQICIWSFTIRYVMQELSVDESIGAKFYLYGLIIFLISRFICTALMSYTNPAKLMSGLSGLAIILTLIAIFIGGMNGVIALISISACMSLMFPTIFGLGVRGLGADTKIGSAGIVMAIVGGAILTPIQGIISDQFSIQASFIVPIICFLVIMFYGWSMSKTEV